MTNPRVNELISEWLEPRPGDEFKETPEVCLGRDEHGNICFRSPKGAWWYSERNYMEWQPLQWDTDEAANSRLLDLLLGDGYCLVQVGMEYVICWPKAFQNGMVVQAVSVDYDRKAAIVKAFVTTKKLTIDDREG